jgi:integrase/recombinase XerD
MEHKMAQAKSLTQTELERVLRYVSTTRYSKRNRAMIMTSFLSGMRVKEIASLCVSDVMDEDGRVRNEIRLSAGQTKGRYGRTVFINEKLRGELGNYLSNIKVKSPSQPLFFTEKRNGFSANTLTQWFFWVYRKAGVMGASSHSGRRTFITTLANRGIGVRILASLAGHRSIAVTQSYIDVNDEMKRNAVELV